MLVEEEENRVKKLEDLQRQHNTDSQHKTRFQSSNKRAKAETPRQMLKLHTQPKWR